MVLSMAVLVILIFITKNKLGNPNIYLHIYSTLNIYDIIDNKTIDVYITFLFINMFRYTRSSIYILYIYVK